jgi:hypothetical protein
LQKRQIFEPNEIKISKFYNVKKYAVCNAGIISTERTRELNTKYEPDEIAVDKKEAPHKLDKISNRMAHITGKTKLFSIKQLI